jgi:predicted TIM-barrel fold metal-dependent hydrolase
MTGDPHRIDVHYHILPAEYVSALARFGVSGGGGIPFPPWSASEALAMMDRDGTVERFSRVRFILSHAGGTTPYLAWRWALLDLHPTIGLELRARAPKGVMHYLRQFHYDTALSANPHALRSLCELVDPSHILFGSDFPFAPEPVTRASVEGLASFDGFDAAGRPSIERDNALALLRTLRRIQ